MQIFLNNGSLILYFLLTHRLSFINFDDNFYSVKAMETVYEVLTKINSVLLIVFSASFIIQIVYIVLFFVPTKKYKPAQKLHKIAVIIPAHNEEKVIFSSVKNLFKQTYPKEFFKIYVIADNCTDRTAERAAEAGAEVIVHSSEKVERKNAGTAVDYAVKYILETDGEVEFFVRFDADNIPHPDYLAKMNDAFDSGAKAAKGFNHALNFTQNTISCISALWYIRDNAFTCRARSFMHLSQMLCGGGMMFSADTVREGFNCYSNSEDAQFTLALARKKIRAHYVADAIVYEDQPSTIGDLFKRNMRMGSGLFKLFFTDGIKSFAKFFVTYNLSLIDLLLSLVFIPIAVVGVIWFPFYYVWSVCWLVFSGNIAAAADVGYMIGIILVFAFVVPFVLQAILAYFVERKKIDVPFKKLVPAFLLFPFYMIVYAIGITLGVLGLGKWKIAERNVFYDRGFIKMFEKACGEKPELAYKNFNLKQLQN